MKHRSLLLALAVAALTAMSFLLLLEEPTAYHATSSAEQPTLAANLPHDAVVLEDKRDLQVREQAAPQASAAPTSSAADAPEVSDARLDVKIVWQQTMWPVADALLLVAALNPVDVTRSDAKGWVSLRIPPAKKLQLQVMAGGGHGSALVEVAPLLPGEQRELVIEVETGDNERFFGRLVADESGAPITAGTAGLYRHSLGLPQGEKLAPRGLLVQGPDKRPDKIVSVDDEGVFELAFASWEEPIVEIQAKCRSHSAGLGSLRVWRRRRCGTRRST